MSYETIILKKESAVARIILNRPEVLNAISPRMFEELDNAFSNVGADTDIRVVILTGAGRAFCASVDLEEETGGKDRFLPDMGPEEQRQFVRQFPQRVTKTITALEKPTIAMVNGPAVGDAFDWVLACDLRIASTNARFMCGFVRMGLIPDTGATWFYPRLLGLTKAFEMLFTESWLEADEALNIGLLNRLVPPEDLEGETMALAKRVAGHSPIALKLVKMHVYRGLQMNLNDALEMAADGEIVAMGTEDHKEALAAFREKRKPVFEGK
jgi:2-(1,2-epoxy-1,2-dihydrophenyl)acetyl-CoA isomerase